MKLKLRKVGNSVGVILPKESVKSYNIGDEIVITIGEVITEKDNDVITKVKEEEVVVIKDWG